MPTPRLRRAVSTTIGDDRSILELIDLAARLCVGMKKHRHVRS
jgi:hypothetical protein